MDSDTIVAMATPAGRGGVGIVRLSGPLAWDLALQFTHKKALKPRYAHYGPIYAPSGEVLDVGIALFFRGPNSFTGDDVFEIQGHGGPVVMDRLIHAALAYGARMARPGEFSERAYLNGKMDLAQAEAISDLINASSEEAAQCAVHSLQGEFSKEIRRFLQGVVGLRTYLEAANDFPDEEIEILEDGDVPEKLDNLLSRIQALLAAAEQGVVLQEGRAISILGKPNAGKSSLFNSITGDASAIVTEVPGTTRDLIKEKVYLGGHIVHLVDTAGIRQDAGVIEAEGIRRARLSGSDAEHILFVVDGEEASTEALRKVLLEETLGDLLPSGEKKHKHLTLVVNKSDLFETPENKKKGEHGFYEVFVSAKENTGIEALQDHLKKIFTTEISSTEGRFLARRRHLDAIGRAKEHLQEGMTQLSSTRAVELLAEDLRAVQSALGEITGEFSQEDLLGEIFSSFCIGK